MRARLPRLVRILARTAVILVLGLGSCTGRDGELGRIHRLGDVDGGQNCGLSSPLVQVQGRSRPTCTGRLAAATFSNALCSCGNIQIASSLRTRGFDSRQGPFQDSQPNQGGASVGVNGSYQSFVAADVGGSLSIAGGSDVSFPGALTVQGDLRAAGNVVVLGTGIVARDAWIAGSLTGLGPISIGGTLHRGRGAVATPLKTGGEVAGAVTIPDPCPCAPGDVLDVAALVDRARIDNDNASLSLSANAFEALAGSSDWTLTCGRAYLSGVGGSGSLVIHVAAWSAIFIDGSINLAGNLSFDVAPGAEVDVFVRNDVAVRGSFALASKDRPAAGRLWAGGAHAITLSSPWIGNLYAPHALVAAHAGLEVWGSIFAADFSGEALASFVFDRAILDAGATCAAPDVAAGECAQCGTCSGGAACVSGSCGACASDSDCCSQSVCSNGSCGPWLSQGDGGQ